MKTILIFTLLICAFQSKIEAQQDSTYYYQFGEKVYITPVAESYIVEFRDTSYAAILDSLELEYSRLWWTIYEVNNDSALVYQINDTLCTINPHYIRDDSSAFYMRDILVLEWNKDVNEQTKQNIISQHQLKLVVEAGPLQHYEVGNAITVANELFETGNFKYCYPEFLVKVIDQEYIPNDEYFDKQWYLHNTGQLTNDGHYGTPGADIKAPAAWDITTGSPDVVVAVIDRGITENHPDLPVSRLVIVPFSNLDPYDDFGWDLPWSTSLYIGHGDNVTGIIAATMDNNEGIAGICPDCQIMPIKWGSFSSDWAPPVLAQGTHVAISEGADIISFAVGVGWHESFVAAINLAIEQGIVVVSSAGNNANNAQGQLAEVTFPASIDNPHVISVGASDRNDLQANYSSTDEKVDVVAPSATSLSSSTLPFLPGEGNNIWTIDMPGNEGLNPYPAVPQGGIPVQFEQLPSSGTNHLAYTGRFGGASAAAPQVSGVAALILSVNPCLTPEKVKNIILSTADKVGGYDYDWNPEKPGHSKQMGYGRLNAYQAVLAASMDIDLYTEDVPGDGGAEPNEMADLLFLSEDIWVRNEPDGLVNQFHENPDYIDENTTVYVYVRVRNRGCNESLGTEELHLYWAKAATALTWPEYWDGSITSPVLMGDEIGVEFIDPIGTNDETIVVFEWDNLPNPEIYDDLNQPWHFCLLSRIVAPHDPMIDELDTGEWNLGHNVKHNNNISWKNISIVNIEPGSAGGSWHDDRVVGATVAIGNASDTVGVFDWLFKLPAVYTGNSLLDVAEVRIILDSLSWQKWESGGKKGENIQVVNEPRRQILITGDSARLENLHYAAHERSLLNLSFNFRTRDFNGIYEYDYLVVQHKSSDGQILGGEKYEIRVTDRELFLASGGDDREIYRNEQVQLSAEELNEDVIYNWYDPNGNLIHTGMDLIVTPQITTTYRLEVIAETDGFKDYDEVEVVVKTAEIINVSPNPVSSILTVVYDTKNVQSAYLVLTKVAQSGITNNYIIDPELDEKTIYVSSLPHGLYNLILVADGEMTDQKTIAIN